MADRQWRDRGGIGELRRVVAEQTSAVEFELIKLGLRLDWLGDDRLSWRDLKVIVNHLPHDNAIARQLEPEAWPWADIHTQLLAILVNKIGNYAHVDTGQRGKYKPDIQPPAIRMALPMTIAGRRVVDEDQQAKRRHTDGASVAEIDHWRERRRASGQL